MSQFLLILTQSLMKKKKRPKLKRKLRMKIMFVTRPLNLCWCFFQLYCVCYDSKATHIVLTSRTRLGHGLAILVREWNLALVAVVVLGSIWKQGVLYLNRLPLTLVWQSFLQQRKENQEFPRPILMIFLHGSW